MSDTSPTFALLDTANLAVRWGYTRQGVHQLAARPGFPTPAAAVNGGRIRVWLLADIEAFEQGRPELGDQVAKRRKQHGYHLARMKGGSPSPSSCPVAERPAGGSGKPPGGPLGVW